MTQDGQDSLSSEMGHQFHQKTKLCKVGFMMFIQQYLLDENGPN